jgi:AraC-like DNA-binding protein
MIGRTRQRPCEVAREASPFPPRGILWRHAAGGKLAHGRVLPAPPLLELVEHYWFVRWDLRGAAPFVQETLPHPSVHWVTEGASSTIQGVPRGRFTRELAGLGRVFGVKFKPGGFHPFHRAPVAAFAGRALTLAAAFGQAGAAIERELVQLAADAADERRMDLAERFLLDRLPPADAQLAGVQQIVNSILNDRDITRVEHLVERCGLHKRALQRLFSQYVGASPKWVIQRYRLHEAVELVAAGTPVSWSRLAADLGYFDQAHFIRDFKALIGRPPSDYAKALAAPQ